MIPSRTPNQADRRLLGVNGLNSYKGNNSASREQMFSSHIGQALPILGSDERYIQTGMEMEFGEYTFNIKMPADATILKIIDRYPSGVSFDSIAFNPQRIAIFERADNKEIGFVDITHYGSQHQYFGYPYKAKHALNKLRVGEFIKAGEVFLDSPNVTDDGGYKFGAQMNVAYMTHPASSEDGILISRDVLHKFRFRTYRHRVVEWGRDRFPLNLYGDINNYKPFPDIGDMVRDDGLLMMLRTYENGLGAVEQSVYDLMEPDPIFDKATYVNGKGGRVVDIKVWHEPGAVQQGTPDGMDAQALKYDNARRVFYKAILDEHDRLKRERRESLVLEKPFHRLVVEALSVVGKNSQSPQEQIRRQYRQAPLDDWRIEFTIEYETVPTIGFKLTDTAGGKGVICNIAEPEHMPVDEHGNRADIVMDPNASLSRMNIGRLYEQYVNSASRDVRRYICQMLNVDKETPNLEKRLLQIEHDDPALFQQCWNYLQGYYSIVSPRMAGWFSNGRYVESPASHLAYIIKKFPYMYVPPDNEPELKEMMAELEAKYKPLYGPVSYVGFSGNRVTTVHPVRIGSIYIMLLEKTGDDWTAVSSGRLQHFGVLSQVTNADKYASPSRNQAIRAWGEAEVRILASYCGPEITADILDRNNNPETHKAILHSLLRADKPTNIDRVVDRNVVRLGGSKPLQHVKHLAKCGGWEFEHRTSNVPPSQLINGATYVAPGSRPWDTVPLPEEDEETARIHREAAAARAVQDLEKGRRRREAAVKREEAVEAETLQKESEAEVPVLIEETGE